MTHDLSRNSYAVGRYVKLWANTWNHKIIHIRET